MNADCPLKDLALTNLFLYEKKNHMFQDFKISYFKSFYCIRVPVTIAECDVPIETDFTWVLSIGGAVTLVNTRTSSTDFIVNPSLFTSSKQHLLYLVK